MRDRRSFLAALGRTAVGGALGVGRPAAARSKARGSAQPGARPNVLFISIDDINDWIGVYGGHPQVRTPTIDAFAERSMMFTRAYTAAPLCNPSRIATMTSVRPTTSGIYSNQDWTDTAPSLVHLAPHFRSHGYRTMAAGKVYHYSWRFANPGEPWMWDEQRFHPPPEYRPDLLPSINGIPNTGVFDWGPLPAPYDKPEAEWGDAVIARWCAERLSQPQPRPFFMACGFFRPHMPWYAPSHYYSLFPPQQVTLPTILPNDLDDIPPMGVAMAQRFGLYERFAVENDLWHEAVAAYLACIAYVDAQLAVVLNALQNGPHADNTIVMLWSDHGYHLGEKLHWEKNALWEEATRIPLLIHVPPATGLPGHDTGGEQCHRTVSLVDLFPTLSALCNIPMPTTPIAGRSLTPLLQQPDAPWDTPAISTWLAGNHSVRSERYRYIRYADHTEELYDHETDPLEWTNRAADPDLAAVREHLATFIPSDGPYIPGPPTPFDDLDEDQDPAMNAYPTSSSGPVTLEFVLLDAADVSLTIFSVQGRRVRTLMSEETFAMGMNRVAWDGRDDTGSPQPGGLYLCVLRTPTRVETRRIVYLPQGGQAG